MTRHEVDDLTFWFGTADAPAPAGEGQAAAPEITVAMSPAAEDVTVVVRHQRTGGPWLRLPLHKTRRTSEAQYFAGTLPSQPAGTNVEYEILVRRGGPHPKAERRLGSAISYRVARVEPTAAARPQNSPLRAAEHETHTPSLIPEETGRIVTGQARDEGGRPAVGTPVRAFAVRLRDEQPIGDATTDAEGRYAISLPSHDGRAASGVSSVRVALLGGDGDELVSSPVRSGGAETETIDVTLQNESSPISEFQRYETTLAPVLEGLPLSELDGHDVAFITANTGIATGHLQGLMEASKRARAAGPPGSSSHAALPPLPAEVWYGWHRQGLDLDDKMWQLPVDALVGTLRAAVENRIVPTRTADDLQELSRRVRVHRLDHLLDTSPNPGGGRLRELLATLPEPLDVAAQHTVAEVLFDERPEPERLSRSLQRAGLSGEQVASVVRTVRLGELTEGHAPLVEQLQPLAGDAGDLSLRALAGLSPDTWLDLAYRHGAPRASDAAAIDEASYATRVRANLEELYPTATLTARLEDGAVRLDIPGGDQIAAFLNEHPAFDVTRTPIDEVVGQERTELASALQAVRRLRTLTTTWEQVDALLDLGLNSEFDVAAKDPVRLAEALEDRMPAAEARAMYERAAAVQYTTVAVMGVLPQLAPTGVTALPAKSADPERFVNHPTLQALFGSLDHCACGHCRSVLSPAAYLVDLLEFLRRDVPKAFAALMARRPDLADIELSCENTERELPAVDLALEVLENAVALPLTVELPPATDLATELTGGNLPAGVVKVLQRTALDVASELHATKERVQLQDAGFTAWTVTDRWRRWTLRQTEQSLLAHRPRAGKGWKERPARLDGLDFAAVVAALDSGSLPADLDVRLRAFAVDERTRPWLVPQSVAVLEPGHRWQVEYVAGLQVAGTIGETSTGTLTMTSADGTFSTKRSYSARAVDATVSALDAGDAGGMLTALLPDSRVFAVENGAAGSWKLTKDAIRVEVTFSPSQLTVAGLAYQSSRDDAGRGAAPQNQNPAAYETVRDAVFPWSLPFNLPLCETRVLLDRAGISRRTLMELWLPPAQSDAGVAHECLGLSVEEAKLISAPRAEQELWRAWGADPDGNGVSSIYDAGAGERVSGEPLKVLSRVSIVLQQARISQPELLDLLGSRYISAAGATPSMLPRNECRSSAMELNPVSPELFDRLHRFIRLQRKLGWSIAELDAALEDLSVNGDIGPATLTGLANVVRLSEALGLPVTEVASWWRGIGTTTRRVHTHDGSREIPSLFDRLFQDPSARREPDPDFTLNPARTHLLVEDPAAVDTVPRLRDKLAAVAAAFGVRPAELATLLDENEAAEDTEAKPLTLENLSGLYRLTRVARALDLTAEDFVRAVRITDDGSAGTAADFCAAVKFIRESGFSLNELAYLLRHEEASGLEAAIADDRIAAILTDVRTAMRAVRDDLGSTAGDPWQGLQAGLGALGWYRQLIDQVIGDLDGAVAVEVAGDLSLATVTIPSDLAAVVRLDGRRLTAGNFLPATAWDRSQPDGLYAAVPPTASAELRAAFETAIAALRTSSDALRRRLARPLSSATLPVFTADTSQVAAGFTPPASLRDRCRVEPTPDGSSSRIVVSGWVDATDTDALKSVLTTAQHAAVDRLRAASDGYTEATISRRLLSPQEIDALLAPGVSPVERATAVLGAAVRHRQITAITTELAHNLALTADATSGVLLDLLAVPDSQAPAVATLLEPAFADSDPQSALSAQAAPEPFALIRRIHKVGILSSRLELDLPQLAALAGTGPLPAARRNLLGSDLNAVLGIDLNTVPGAASAGGAGPRVPAAPYVPFLAWRRTAVFARLRRRQPGAAAMIDAYTAALLAPDRSIQERKAAGLAVLAAALSVPSAVVTAAADRITARGLTLDDPIGIDALLDLITALTRLGVAPEKVPLLTDVNASWENAMQGAALARSVLRSRYESASWPDVIRPVSDELRVRQREALIDHLVHQKGVVGADGLYEHYLIDVLTAPCMTTTRLLQATAAVQLFVNRCLLALEPDVEAGSINRARWDPMKGYRVWQANREVFLWPQNWMHPELRGDASDAFRAIQSTLGEAEPSAQSARDALLGYLDDLVEISELTTVGMYQHPRGPGPTDPSDLYIVGRTAETPYRHFWRVCEDFGGGEMRWRPWERLDLDISGTHAMPFVLDGDPHLAWPTFRKQASSGDWEVQFAYARRTARGWGQQHLGRDTVRHAEMTNIDERRTFTFALQIEDIPPRANTKEALPLTSRRTEQATVITCYGAADPTALTPHPNHEDARAGRAELKLSIRVLLKHEKQHWPAAGATAVIRVRSLFAIPTIPADTVVAMARLPLGGAGENSFVINGSTFYENSPSHAAKLDDVLATNAVKFTLQVHYQDRSSPETPFPPEKSGPSKTWTFNYEFEAGTSTLEKLAHPDRDVTWSRLGSFVIGTQTGVQWQYDRGPNLHRDASGRPSENGVIGPLGDDYVSRLGHGKVGFVVMGRRSNLQFAAAPGRFLAAPTNPGGSVGWEDNPREDDVWHYQDGAGRYFLQGLATGKWLILADGHPLAAHFRRQAADDLSDLYSPSTQGITDDGSLLETIHHPERARGWATDRPDDPIVDPRSHTTQGVDFAEASPYALYNWELFLHVPVLIADHLSRQQRFAEADAWLRLVFDSASNDAPSAAEPTPARLWRFLPFRTAGRPDRVEDLLEWLTDPGVAHPGEQNFGLQIAAWKDNPFSPYEIARLRPGAYQWDVQFACLDNCLDWADDRFRRDTRESLVEATMLYVQAAKMLGPRPSRVQRQGQPPPLSYRALAGRWSEHFANAWYTLADTPLVKTLLEHQAVARKHSVNGVRGTSSETAAIAMLASIRLTYFCVPHNNRLLAYWDRVEDRLFKIRHCQNIEGVERELPLFDPPIDPDLLVRAVAAGLSIDQVLAEGAGPASQYRFAILAPKASELCGELKGLGAAVLAALEKKDAEKLARVRSTQEARLLDLVETVRLQQIADADANVDALRTSREAVASRYRHYQHLLTGQAVKEPAPGSPVTEEPSKVRPAASAVSGASGLGVTQTEADQLGWLAVAQNFGIAAGISNMVAGTLFAGGVWPTTSPMFQSLGHASNAAASMWTALSANASHNAGRDALIGGYQRRGDDWTFQSNSALRELAQVDKQIVAAEIRAAIADHELTSHRQQMANAQAVDDFMRDKYTNEQLYTWMTGQLAAVHVAAYQLALDMARQAQRAFRFELYQPDATFIRPRYGDTLHKGLTAGEQLSHDIKRMEVAYLERNRREHELTRHVSLLQLDPLALLQLRINGRCEFDLPEALFDIDSPGHFLRRLKSVGLSIPCVVGPYTAVHCKLTLLHSEVRHRADGGTQYARDRADGADDPRFADDYGLAESVVTSGTVDATGLWEPQLRDERRLPFEGRGAISRWRLELPAKYRQFDYEHISDVVLTLRYSARDGGESLRTAAVSALDAAFTEIEAQPLAILISLRHEFPSEWARWVAPESPDRSEPVAIARQRFPRVFGQRALTVERVDVFIAPRGNQRAGSPPSGTPPVLLNTPPPPAAGAPAVDLALTELDSVGAVRHLRADGLSVAVKEDLAAAKWTIGTPQAVRAAARDVVLVLTYTAAKPAQK